MGVVYRAHDTLLEREVALKIISASIEGHSELRERFYREARAAGQLSHRNVITIHDLGEHEGQPYLAMELLKGEDLQHRLTRPDPMSLARKLEIASEICDGLGYAHRRGLIHRDIKPANIFITDEGVVKLLDFGLARMVTSELTKSNVMLGTLNYMAPEQVRGERIDHRADIFSFGVVLYEILSGRKAFQGDSFATTLFKILQDVPEPLLNIDATLPHEVVRLVERAIAKNREERYQDLAELARDLALQRQHLAVADHPTSVGTVPPAYQLSHPPTLPAGTRRPESARPKSAPRERDLDGATTSPEASTISAAAPAGLVPGRRSPAPRVMAFGAALAVVAVIGGLYWVTRLADTPARQATVDTPPPRPAPSSQAGQAAPPLPPESVGPKVPVVSTPPATSTAPTAAALDAQVVQEARDRMTRAKAAAVKAGPSAQRSRSFTEALAAEREGLRHHQSKRMADAVTKFYEATGLFQSAAASAFEATAPPSTARVEGTRPPPPGSTSTPGVPGPPATAPQAGPPIAAPTTAPPPQPDPAPTPAEPPPPLPIPPATRPSATPAVPAEAAKPAEDAVRDLVRRYELALEARSVEALKRVWPSLQGAQEAAIRQEFSHSRRIDVEIAGTEITMAANAATVTFLRRYQLSTVDGQRLLTNSRTTLNARRNGDEWIIERVRFEAVK